ncbi:hypothetical protein SDC9_162619 [bioreactor metagenome]|uniref:Uncharacterized protein n=1 Tax=bioreactor metagenome TaxID=1076179 RepID=A0A645FPK6_9ZZZZ
MGGGIFHNGLACFVVQIQNSRRTHEKELRFGFQVFFHGYMEIKMILGQIGKDADIEIAAIHAV